MAQNWPGTLLDEGEEQAGKVGRGFAPAKPTQPAPPANQNVPAAEVAPVAVDPAQPPGQELPYDPLAQGDIGFASGDTMIRDTPAGNDEYTHDVTQGILKGDIQTADDLIAVAEKYGVPRSSWDAERIKQVNDALAAVKAGAGLGGVGSLEYASPDVEGLRKKDVLPEGVDAFARGAVPFGLGDELGAAVDTARFGGGFGENLHKNRAVRDYDEENNWGARLTGEIVGSLALPTAVAGEANTAVRLAVREGIAAGLDKAAIRKLATSAGRRAAVGQMTKEGAIYGGAYGAGSADGNIGDRAVGGAGGAATGALAAAGLGSIGSRFAKLTPRAKPPVDYRQLSRDLEIPRMPGTAGGAVQQTTQAGLGALPGAAPAVRKAAEAETDALGNALTRTAEDIGPVSTRQGAGEAISKGANAYETAAKETANTMYKARDAAFGGASAPVVMMNSAKVGRDIASQFPNSKAFEQLSEHPAVRKILNGIPDDGEVTLDEATEALSHIRGVQRSLEAKADASGPVLARVRQLKNAIQKDVYAAAEAADQAYRRAPGSVGSALKAQKDADAFYRDYSQAMKGTFKTAAGSADNPIMISPDKVFNQLASDTQRKGGNIARLRDTWFRLPEDARNAFAATHLAEMGRAKAGAQEVEGDKFSFNTFLTNFDNMSPQARKIVFGREVDAQIRDIATYASRLRQQDKLRNFSNTASQLMTTGLLGTIGYSLFHGDPKTAAEALGLAAGSWGTAKLFLGTPAMRDWTKKALGLATTIPAARQPAAAKPLIAKLAVIARENPVISNEVFALQDRLRQLAGGAVPAPVAAEKTGQGSLRVEPNQGNEGQDYPGEELPQ